jgi:D-beta-D-heptose 7-phosphate kinase/D-beta-D-heptose 1-phosphate adenosyltransferase
VTTVKTRFVASGHRRGGQHLLRTDREDRRPIHPKLAERLLRIAREAMAATSVVVLSDYRKGVLGGVVAPTLIAAAKASGRRVVADLRAADWAIYAGADVIVPHARDVLGEDGHGADLAAATKALRAAHGFGAVLVKCGDAGFLFADADGEVLLPLVPADPVDLSGAGDAAVATFAAALATGADLRRAATLATVAAGVIGAVPGNTLARPAALIAALGG